MGIGLRSLRWAPQVNSAISRALCNRGSWGCMHPEAVVAIRICHSANVPDRGCPGGPDASANHGSLPNVKREMTGSTLQAHAAQA